MNIRTLTQQPAFKVFTKFALGQGLKAVLPAIVAPHVALTVEVVKLAFEIGELAAHVITGHQESKEQSERDAAQLEQTKQKQKIEAEQATYGHELDGTLTDQRERMDTFDATRDQLVAENPESAAQYPSHRDLNQMRIIQDQIVRQAQSELERIGSETKKALGHVDADHLMRGKEITDYSEASREGSARMNNYAKASQHAELLDAAHASMKKVKQEAVAKLDALDEAALKPGSASYRQDFEQVQHSWEVARSSARAEWKESTETARSARSETDAAVRDYAKKADAIEQNSQRAQKELTKEENRALHQAEAGRDRTVEDIHGRGRREMSIVERERKAERTEVKKLESAGRERVDAWETKEIQRAREDTRIEMADCRTADQRAQVETATRARLEAIKSEARHAKTLLHDDAERARTVIDENAKERRGAVNTSTDQEVKDAGRRLENYRQAIGEKAEAGRQNLHDAAAAQTEEQRSVSAGRISHQGENAYVAKATDPKGRRAAMAEAGSEQRNELAAVSRDLTQVEQRYAAEAKAKVPASPTEGGEGRHREARERLEHSANRLETLRTQANVIDAKYVNEAKARAADRRQENQMREPRQQVKQRHQ